MKKRRLLALSLCLALPLTACGGRTGSQSASGSVTSAETSAEPQPVIPAAADELTLGFYSVEGLHPYTCDNAVNQLVTHLIYEPLFELDETFAPEPCLAESCSYGESSCTVKLRRDISFSNGDAMTASDVTYSLEQAKKGGSIYADRLSNLKSVRAQGDREVILTLKEGDKAFASLLDVPIIQEGTGKDKFPKGTGPYQVKQKGSKASKLTQNKAWWQEGELPVKEIGLYQAEDSDMLIFGFDSGAVSMVSTDLTGTESLTYTGQFNVVDYPTTSLVYLGCNTRAGSCRNENFRQVLIYAVDRETLARKMFSGHAEAAVLPVSPRSKLYDAKLAEKYAFSEDKAKEDLKETYYEGSTQKLIVNKESAFKTALASEIQKELGEIGIDVKVEKLSWKEFSKALEKREFDLYLGEVKLTNQFDLSELVSKEGSLNYGGYKDRDLEKLVYELEETGEDKRPGAAKKLYEAVLKRAPIIPLCFKNHSILTHWGTDTVVIPTQHNPFYHIQEWKLTAPEQKK